MSISNVIHVIQVAITVQHIEHASRPDEVRVSAWCGGKVVTAEVDEHRFGGESLHVLQEEVLRKVIVESGLLIDAMKGAT